MLNGFLNIHKAQGWTSHDVVAKARKILGIQKIGHTGTLDPDATGVLPICVGKATKVSQYMIDADKEYQVVMRLGEATNTLDASGTVVSRTSTRGLPKEAVHRAFMNFQGTFDQQVPMFSAVKVRGQPLYEAARKNQTVERPSRRVTVHRLTVDEIQDSPEGDTIDVRFEVVCSKGTYIRTICADIGEILGVGCHLLRLVRTRSGPFRLQDSITVEELQRLVYSGEIGDRILKIQEVLSGYPGLWVSPRASARVLHGGWISGGEVTRIGKDFKTGEPLLVYNSANQLVAVALAEMGSDRLTEVDRRLPILRINRVLV